MKYVLLLLSAIVTNAARRWRVWKLSETVSAYEAELHRVRAMRLHCEVSESIIAEKKRDAEVALYHASRKGSV